MSENKNPQHIVVQVVLVAVVLVSLVVAGVVIYQEHCALTAYTCATTRYVHAVSTVQCGYDTRGGHPRSPACLETERSAPSADCPPDAAE